jgi:ubiquinone/menaquinone biosynthesis C-methylase UbiE
MPLYDDWILPVLLDLAMRHPEARRLRRELVPRAQGRVLEIGAGSGLNLPFYGPKVTELYALEPSAQLRRIARRRARHLRFPVEFLASSAEGIPLPSGSIDTVVSTWTLCTIPDVERALAEMRRVLVPDGELLFVEHGLAPDASVRHWQHRLTPGWRRIAGGCHLDRSIDELIANAGFAFDALHRRYIARPKLMTYTYSGQAKPQR